jgi:FemAB-related protein (PEP-CTERM system-associated)
MIAVADLTEDTRLAWDAYVRGADLGLPTHLAGWREVMHKTGGYATRYLLAHRDETVVGVLPMFFVRSALVGNTAMTMPGGLCADDVEAASALVQAGQAAARRAGMRRFVLQDGRQAWPGGLHTRSSHVHWVVDVGMDSEALWNRLHRNLRRQVRMARSNGLAVEIDRTGQALPDFYAVFSRFCHEAGTPVYSRHFLENVVDAFPGGFNIAVVRREGQAIGGFFQLELGEAMVGMWGATLHAYLELRPNYLAYWSLLEDAAQRGFRLLDMGRSPAGSNASAFKGQWGGACSPVYQQTARLDAAGSTGNGAHPDGAEHGTPGMQLVTRLWPSLPLAVASYLGPKLRRHVPFG